MKSIIKVDRKLIDKITFPAGEVNITLPDLAFEEEFTIVQYDQQSERAEAQGILESVFLNGVLKRKTTLKDIRETVASQIGA